jgi:hypothetical protein
LMQPWRIQLKGYSQQTTEIALTFFVSHTLQHCSPVRTAAGGQPVLLLPAAGRQPGLTDQQCNPGRCCCLLPCGLQILYDLRGPCSCVNTVATAADASVSVKLMNQLSIHRRPCAVKATQQTAWRHCDGAGKRIVDAAVQGVADEACTHLICMFVCVL